MFPSNQWLESGEGDTVINLSSALDSKLNKEEQKEEENEEEEKPDKGM